MANRIEKITLPGKAGYHVNIYLVRGRHGAVLVDTGYQDTAAEVLEMIVPASVEKILLTHYHPDHSDAAGILAAGTGAEIHAHRLEVPMIEERYRGIKVTALEDSDQVGIAGALFRVVHTPGHSPGHAVFLRGEEKVLFSGDLVVGENTTWVGPPDGDIGEYLASLERIRRLDIVRICPGHGPDIEQPMPKITSLIRHRNLRERQVLSRLRRGDSTIDEIVAEIYPVLDERFRIAAHLTIAGHLIKLEREGRVVRLSGREERYQLVFEPD